MKGKLSVILRVMVSVGLVGFLLWRMRGQFPAIVNTLTKTNFLLFSLAAVIFIVEIGLVLSFRLRLLFVGEGLDIPIGRVIQLSYIGYFFNLFLPTAVGGDIVKAYYAHKQTKKTAKSFIAVFMDRFIGLFSFICLAMFALVISWRDIDPSLRKIVFLFALAGLILFSLILNDAITKVIFKFFSKLKFANMGERLSRVYRAVREYKNKKTLLLSVIAISLLAQAIYFVVIYMLVRSLGASMAIKSVFLLMPIVSVISMLPSLGGLGLREGAIVMLFGSSIGSDNAFSVSILLLSVLLIAGLLGALIYASAAQFKIKGDISKLEKYSI